MYMTVLIYNYRTTLAFYFALGDPSKKKPADIMTLSKKVGGGQVNVMFLILI